MELRYIESNKNIIVFNPCFEADLPQKAVMEVGVWKKQVDILHSDEIDENCIGIPNKLFSDFRLPDRIDYSIKIEGRSITIGPIIGFMPFSKEITLSNDVLNKKLKYFYRYDEIGGLIFICKPNSFHFKNNTVDGCAYIPKDNPFKCEWEKGIFPLPSAIYKRVGLTSEVYNKLLLRMGDKIFNSYFLDKLELWQYLSSYPTLKEHLPQTMDLKTVEDVVSLLSTYKCIYLKPIDKNKSKGIVTLEKGQEGLFLLKQQNAADRNCTLTELKVILEEMLKKGRYIAQQGIEIKLYKNRRYDFRVIMQKGYLKQWECTGIFARFGKKNSFVTNFTVSGFGMKGYDALRTAFDLSPKEAFVLEKEIIFTCKLACEKLDQSIGNYADLGIDVMIDENHNTWILEINQMHDHHFPVLAGKDKQLQYELVSKPFLYAKALTGF